MESIPPECSPGLTVAFRDGMLAGNSHFLFRVAASLQLSRYLHEGQRCHVGERMGGGVRDEDTSGRRDQKHPVYLMTLSRQLICW